MKKQLEKMRRGRTLEGAASAGRKFPSEEGG